DWRHRHTLAESVIGQIDLAPRRRPAQNARSFTRQIDTGARADAEGTKAIVEALGAKPERDLGRADIRGDFDYPAEVQPAVRAVVVDDPPSYAECTLVAVDSHGGRNDAVLQRDRREQPLHRRARLESVLRGAVVKALAGVRAVGSDIGERQHLPAEWIEYD